MLLFLKNKEERSKNIAFSIENDNGGAQLASVILQKKEEISTKKKEELQSLDPNSPDDQERLEGEIENLESQIDEYTGQIPAGVSRVLEHIENSPITEEYKTQARDQLSTLLNEREAEISAIDATGESLLIHLAYKTSIEVANFEEEEGVREIFEILEPMFEKREEVISAINYAKYKTASGDWEKINEELANLGISEEMIEKFQEYQNIEVDGKTGPETIQAMAKVLNVDISTEFGAETEKGKEIARKNAIIETLDRMGIDSVNNRELVEIGKTFTQEDVESFQEIQIKMGKDNFDAEKDLTEAEKKLIERFKEFGELVKDAQYKDGLKKLKDEGFSDEAIAKIKEKYGDYESYFTKFMPQYIETRTLYEAFKAYKTESGSWGAVKAMDWISKKITGKDSVDAGYVGKCLRKIQSGELLSPEELEKLRAKQKFFEGSRKVNYYSQCGRDVTSRMLPGGNMLQDGLTAEALTADAISLLALASGGIAKGIQAGALSAKGVKVAKAVLAADAAVSGYYTATGGAAFAKHIKEQGWDGDAALLGAMTVMGALGTRASVRGMRAKPKVHTGKVAVDEVAELDKKIRAAEQTRNRLRAKGNKKQAKEAGRKLKELKEQKKKLQQGPEEPKPKEEPKSKEEPKPKDVIKAQSKFREKAKALSQNIQAMATVTGAELKALRGKIQKGLDKLYHAIQDYEIPPEMRANLSKRLNGLKKQYRKTLASIKKRKAEKAKAKKKVKKTEKSDIEIARVQNRLKGAMRGESISKIESQELAKQVREELLDKYGKMQKSLGKVTSLGDLETWIKKELKAGEGIWGGDGGYFYSRKEILSVIETLKNGGGDINCVTNGLGGKLKLRDKVQRLLRKEGVSTNPTIRELWPEGIQNHIEQNMIGDCYLLAGMDAMKKNPKFVRRLEQMIKKTDRGWDVTFYSKKGEQLEEVVVPITRAEIGQISSTGMKGALGDRLIERAYSRFARSLKGEIAPTEDVLGKKWMHRSGMTTLLKPEKMAISGGRTEDVFEHFFGPEVRKGIAPPEDVHATMMQFGDNPNYFMGASSIQGEGLLAKVKSMPREKQKDWLSSETYRDLLQGKNINTDRIKYYAKDINGRRVKIHTGHAYSIGQVNKTEKWIEVINPHDTKNMRYRISFDEFGEKFASINIGEFIEKAAKVS